MFRWLLFALTVLTLALVAAPASADGERPRVNPYTGRPYTPEQQARWEARMREWDEEERIAREASDRFEREYQAKKAANADQIKRFDDAVEAWRKTHPAPEGTRESMIASSYDGETALPESARITYFNRWDVPTHTVAFDASGQPTGSVTQTQQGKAWETIGPRIPPGGGVEILYDKDFDGNEIIKHVRIFNEGGRVVGAYDFNFDGIAWRGETWDPETRKRNGGFQDDRLKPPEPTLGGPLAEPPTQRAITGVCQQCRPLANEHNDLVARINAIAIEMKSLSQQHQHAWPPAQKPIEMRHAYLAAELARLMPQFEALRARVLECEKQCRAAEARPDPQAALSDVAARPAPQGPGEPQIAPEPTIQPTREAIPASNGDLQQVIDAAQLYLDAANCEGMECPVCDCDQAREALQALTDMEAYLVAMEPYVRAANDLQMERMKTAVENAQINATQRRKTIQALAFQQYFHNFGSMLLDIASVSSWVKEVVTGKGLDEASPTEVLDKLNGWYEAAKDLESLVNTGAESLTGEEQQSGIADAVDLAGGVDKDFINDTTSTIADAKSIIVAALKEGKDWRKALKDEGAAAALGQIAGRYLKSYSAARLKERQQALGDLLRDADAGDLVQAQIYLDLTRVQQRRFMLEDALAAVRAAKAAYVGCTWRACGPMTLTRPTIPSFVEDVPGAKPKLSWGRALPWFNAAIARTLPRMQPVAFHEGDCPKEKKEEPRTAGDPPTPVTAVQGDAPALARPQFIRIPDLQLPASFCSEVARNAFMTDVYNPAVANALENARVAAEHQAYLNGLFTQHMRANSPWWGQVRTERDAFEPFVGETAAKAQSLGQLYSPILAVPIVPCDGEAPRTATGPATPPVEELPVIPGTPAVPVTPETPKPKKDDCPPKQGRKPIVVGPNSKVGSGAQLRGKLGGMALGALAGAAGLGGGGGGGGSDGPQLWTCKIKDSEFTVFNDPTTGVSLAVGAKRAGGKLVIFSKVEKAPDKGTFQTAFLERPSTGETIAPSDVGPCDLWGEWKLTVSWTRSTYVDGALVSRESGGWSEGGFFRIPGVLSKVDAPDGLWKRMGFSNASNGARQIATVFNAPAGGGPLTFVVHVTRPKRDPVDTVPFVLTLTEGPDGKISVTRAEDPPCPPTRGDEPAESILDDIEEGPPVLTGGTGIASDRPGERPAAPPPSGTPGRPGAPIASPGFATYIRTSTVTGIRKSLEELEATRCQGPEAWEARRKEILARLRSIIDYINTSTPEGPDAAKIATELAGASTAAGLAIGDIEALVPPSQAQPAAPAGSCPTVPPESLLDDIQEGPPVLTGGTGAASDRPGGAGRTTSAPSSTDGGGAPESILDDIEDGPPVLTGGTGIASDRAAATPRQPPKVSDPDARPLHISQLVHLADGLAKVRAEDLAMRRDLDRARCEGPTAWNAKRTAYLKRLRERLDIMARIEGMGRDKAAIDSAATDESVRLREEIAEVEAMSPPVDPQSCPLTPTPEGGSILDSIEEVLVPA